MRVETPSHTGGVSEEARRREEERRGDGRGLRTESSKDTDKEFYRREWRREGGDERNAKVKERDRERERERRGRDRR